MYIESLVVISHNYDFNHILFYLTDRLAAENDPEVVLELG